MRKVSFELDRGGGYVRVERGRADGYPQPELAAVLHVGGWEREFVTVARAPKVDGMDVLYRLDDSVAGRAFETLVSRGKVTVDCSTGFALVKPPKDGREQHPATRGGWD